jgi:hypothetical protein
MNRRQLLTQSFILLASATTASKGMAHVQTNAIVEVKNPLVTETQVAENWRTHAVAFA